MLGGLAERTLADAGADAGDVAMIVADTGHRARPVYELMEYAATAMRQLDGSDWVKPASFSASKRPAFKAKAGRTVVLALSNRGETETAFHLHGHHFRLLDRLDDGWKPFWLDTLAVAPGQTQRIAFLAEFPGRWLLESTATQWEARRLVRWYSVE